MMCKNKITFIKKKRIKLPLVLFRTKNIKTHETINKVVEFMIQEKYDKVLFLLLA